MSAGLPLAVFTLSDGDCAPAWTPDPRRQATASYTVEDLLTAQAPGRLELYDGRMFMVPTPTMGHNTLARLLANWLEAHTDPAHYDLATDVGVMINTTTVLEPDVVVLRAPADPAHHLFAPEQVVLVVEIVSPSTRRADRFTKPPRYAAAGIAHYWRVEQDPVRVCAYQLHERGGGYELAAETDGVLELTEPFAVRLDLKDLRRG